MTELIKLLDEISDYCHEERHRIMRDTDLATTAIDLDRFNLKSFGVTYKQLASKLQLQISKLVVMAGRIPICRDAEAISNELFRILKKLASIVYSYPMQCGKTCKKMINHRLCELLKHVYDFSHQLSSGIGGMAELRGEQLVEEARIAMMKDLLRTTGYIIDCCEQISSDPTDNKQAILKDFRHLVEQFDDVTCELNDLYMQKYVDDTNDSDIENETPVQTPEEFENSPTGTTGEEAGEDDAGEEQEETVVELDPFEDLYGKLVEQGKAMEEIEKDRVKKVEALLTFGSILLRKIITRCISEESSEKRDEDIKWMDELFETSLELSRIIDDLGSSCHPPQSCEQIAMYAREFAGVIGALCSLGRFRASDKHVEWFNQWQAKSDSRLQEVLDLAPFR